MKKIAFIDLGSNSVRFVVYEIETNKSYKLIYQQKDSIRLSEGLFEHNRLTPEAIGRALQTLKAYAKMIRLMDVHHTIAVATAAVRQANNGKEFIQLVHKETGINIHVISGQKEAYLGYLGVTNTMALNDFILFDLGGASIEVTLVKSRMVAESRSFPIGAITLKERFHKKKELTADDENAMITHIKGLFDEEPWLKNLKLPIIGIGGTVRTIAKIDQREINYPLPKLHNYPIRIPTFRSIYKSLGQMSLSQRKKVDGLSADRADIIVTGMMIIDQLIHYTNATDLYVSGSGLREGLFFDYYGKHILHGQVIIDDILTHSAENFFHSLHMNDSEHTQYVRHMADILFTQWFPLHGCEQRMRKILNISALLHDAGKMINYYSHARHSAYVLLNSSLYGLSHKEQVMAALIAGWSSGNNGSLPVQQTAEKLLSKEELFHVKKISTILAIAETLDESHEQGVNYVETLIEDKQVTLMLHVNPNMNSEILTVLMEKMQKSFKKSYGKTLIIQIKENTTI